MANDKRVFLLLDPVVDESSVAKFQGWLLSRRHALHPARSGVSPLTTEPLAKHFIGL